MISGSLGAGFSASEMADHFSPLEIIVDTLQDTVLLPTILTLPSRSDFWLTSGVEF